MTQIKEPVRARVIDVVMDHHPYVVTIPLDKDVAERVKKGDKEGTITFDLSDWKGKRPPRKRQIALLSGLYETTEGWAAELARPSRLTD